MIKQNYLEVFLNSGDQAVIKTGEDHDEFVAIEKEYIDTTIKGLKMCLDELEASDEN